MPTSGLVLTAERPDATGPILDHLATEPLIEPAAPVGVRVPLVVDSPDKATDKRVWEWLHQLPGVVRVDVAFVYLGDNPPASPQQLEASQ